MAGKIEIDELPVTGAFLRRKRMVQERGELALIEDGETFQHLGYFSLKRGKGFFRGGHYHERKVERFYVISGRLRVRLVDLDQGGAWEVTLKAGQRVRIHPRCAHRFEAEQDAQVIEYYDSSYDPDDDLPYSHFPGGEE